MRALLVKLDGTKEEYEMTPEEVMNHPKISDIPAAPISIEQRLALLEAKVAKLEKD